MKKTLEVLNAGGNHFDSSMYKVSMVDCRYQKPLMEMIMLRKLQQISFESVFRGQIIIGYIGWFELDYFCRSCIDEFQL